MFGLEDAINGRNTHASLQQAASYIKKVKSREGPPLACPQEIVYRHGWIGQDSLLPLAEPLVKSGYGDYLQLIA